jgi:hypothetical protein
MNDEMTRTIVTISKKTLKRLKNQAMERNISFAALVRETLDEKAGDYPPFPRSIGIFDSGRTDLARLAGDVRPEPRSWR